MKAITKPRSEPGFELADRPIPEIGPQDVLIQVKTASICGTDLHITQWDSWSASRIKPPMIYGHEFSGVVSQVGAAVETLKPGDAVSAEMHLTCGECPQCLTGNAHICNRVKIVGVDQDGCFAEYVKLPKQQVIKLPSNISFEIGACLDSLGNAVHAVSRGDVSGKSVLVVGCGPIGLFSIAVAQALGATRVFASDVSPYRLQMATTLGAQAFRADQCDVVDEVLSKTQGQGVDVVLEMSGNPTAMREGFKSLKLGGTVVLLGIPKSPVELDVTNAIIFKEARVLGVNGREIFKTWFLMLELLASHKLNIDQIITHRFPLAQFGDAIALLSSGQSGKVLLEINP